MKSRSFRMLGAAIAALMFTMMATTAHAQAAFQDGKPVNEEDGFFRYIDPDVLKKMRAQEPLTKAASVLRWEVEKSGYAGYADIALEGNGVALHWKGDVPATMKTAMSTAGAPVRVVPATHSQADLRAAITPIYEYMKKHPGGPVHSVGIKQDGSSIEVGSATADLQKVAADLPKSNIPVKVVRKEAPQMTSRLEDSAPYYGGARFRNLTKGGYCTSGFGVKNGAGTEFMLTAAHCYTAPDQVGTYDSRRYIGTASHEAYWHDLIMIPTDAGTRIYDGGVGSGEFSKPVRAWDWVYTGDYLCISGSVSGVVCNIIQGNGYTFAYCDWDSDGDWTCMNDLLLAYQNDGREASQPGDSGAPIFGLRSDGVVAKGIHSASGGRSVIVYQDFGTAWRDFNITVNY
ncbi:S1 family peptidase [Actinomadura sp. 6N118]|uniref:S1 family peptidase n=1 Tax=Actinomadura sp. 6N118 TaxID=3375151 RepID=UPI0037BA88CA